MKIISGYFERFYQMYQKFCAVCFIAVMSCVLFVLFVVINKYVSAVSVLFKVVAVSLISCLLCNISVRLRAVARYASLPVSNDDFKKISDDCLECINCILSISVVKYNKIELVLHYLSSIYILVIVLFNMLYDFIFMDNSLLTDKRYMSKRYMYGSYKSKSPIIKSLKACLKYFNCDMNAYLIVEEVVYNNYEYNDDLIKGIFYKHAKDLSSYHK